MSQDNSSMLDDPECVIERLEAKREKYGTLNPQLSLLTSDELAGELQEIVNESRAKSAKTISANGSEETVTVELTFSVDDSPEMFPERDAE